MRLPGFTAAVVLDRSRRHYYQAVSGVVAGTQGVVLPADSPSSGKSGVGIPFQPRWGWCPANPGVPAPQGACPSDGHFSCDYAKARCACYGETDPSGCCDYYDENCLVTPPGIPGNGGGGMVGGPRPGGAKLT